MDIGVSPQWHKWGKTMNAIEGEMMLLNNQEEPGGQSSEVRWEVQPVGL